MTPEGEVKKAIKKVLADHNIVPATTVLKPDRVVNGWYYMPVSNGMGKHGIPDFIVCYLGYFLSIEAKAPKGAPTPLQELNQTIIQASGAKALITSDVYDVMTALYQIKRMHDAVQKSDAYQG